MPIASLCFPPLSSLPPLGRWLSALPTGKMKGGPAGGELGEDAMLLGKELSIATGGHPSHKTQHPTLPTPPLLIVI